MATDGLMEMVSRKRKVMNREAFMRYFPEQTWPAGLPVHRLPIPGRGMEEVVEMAASEDEIEFVAVVVDDGDDRPDDGDDGDDGSDRPPGLHSSPGSSVLSPAQESDGSESNKLQELLGLDQLELKAPYCIKVRYEQWKEQNPGLSPRDCGLKTRVEKLQSGDCRVVILPRPKLNTEMAPSTGASGATSSAVDSIDPVVLLYIKGLEALNRGYIMMDESNEIVEHANANATITQFIFRFVEEPETFIGKAGSELPFPNTHEMSMLGCMIGLCQFMCVSYGGYYSCALVLLCSNMVCRYYLCNQCHQ
jgi:hypothetical protein